MVNDDLPAHLEIEGEVCPTICRASTAVLPPELLSRHLQGMRCARTALANAFKLFARHDAILRRGKALPDNEATPDDLLFDKQGFALCVAAERGHFCRPFQRAVLTHLL